MLGLLDINVPLPIILQSYHNPAEAVRNTALEMIFYQEVFLVLPVMSLEAKAACSSSVLHKGDGITPVLESALPEVFLGERGFGHGV